MQPIRTLTTLKITLAAVACWVALAGTAVAFPGQIAACPADAAKEVALLPYARANVAGFPGPCDCQTLVTCMNLDKTTATVKGQFFHPVLFGQQGSDAVITLDPGQALSVGTAPDPLSLRVGADAGLAGATYAALGRVCASSTKLACDAVLSCSCGAGGAVISPLNLIIKKQRGD